ncbi:hypothetical protein LPE509_00972 [Legionella pneumophila subsp. pneumophila LPE509]|nr:hypothetical protein LPE509_00972 [Legionella pneumophila subsp. pneumophila LPE509]
MLLSPGELAVIMGDENHIQRYLDKVIEPHFRSANRADCAEKRNTRAAIAEGSDCMS